jgi:hypothetical protein
MDLKMKFEKEKKTKRPSHPFGPDGPAQFSPPAHYSLPFPFSFHSGADRWVPPVSLRFPLPFFFSLLPSSAPPAAAAAADSAAPRLFPFLSFLPEPAN